MPPAIEQNLNKGFSKSKEKSRWDLNQFKDFKSKPTKKHVFKKLLTNLLKMYLLYLQKCDNQDGVFNHECNKI